MALLGAILRGCTRTRDLQARCNFELGSEDDFDIDDQLRQLATQLEAIQFMIAQLNEQFLPNATRLPAPRVEEIRTRIWAKLEDALRAELEAEAVVFSSCISGMGISDIFKQIMSGVSHQELTETMREEIQLEERSWFRNLLLVARGQAMDYALAECYNSFFRPTIRRYVGLPSFLYPPSPHRASVLLRSNLSDAIPSGCLLSCTICI